jgi:transglutaminase-like putative cysteine protease
MLYKLHLKITYAFDRPSGAGRQVLRVLPAAIKGRQSVMSAAITIEPKPLEERQYLDFFGTDTVEVVMPAGLTEVVFDMTAMVDRLAPTSDLDISPPLHRLTAEVDEVRHLGPASPHHFLAASPRIPRVASIAEFAAAAVKPGVTTREAVAALGAALHKAMIFDAKATEVDTPIAVAFDGRRGVCQDFAQIMIAGLRSLGVPAAYVAGFLRTLPPPGKKRLEGVDAMHAWVRAWAGADLGWVDYDPTNACFVGLDHLEVGFGRDYSDVAPVTGMLRLDGRQSGSHAVDIVAI